MCTFNFCLSLGERGGGVIIFLTFYINNISRGCIHTLVQIQNLKILHKKKLILKSLYFYTYIKRTPKYKPELPSLCSRRDHTEYTGSIVGLSDIVVGLCINYIYSMQGSIGQPAKVRKRVRGKNKTLIMWDTFHCHTEYVNIAIRPL